MEYNIEFVERVLLEQKKERNRLKGICQIIDDITDSIKTEKTTRTIDFIKSRFPSKNYVQEYDRFGELVGFIKAEKSRPYTYRFKSQEERVSFLTYLINELNLESEKPIKVTRYQKIKKFLNNLFRKLCKY